MTSAQLARIEAMAKWPIPTPSDADRAALAALLAERTALREALIHLLLPSYGLSADLLGVNMARAALGGEI